MTNNPNELKKIDELMAVEVMGWTLNGKYYDKGYRGKIPVDSFFNDIDIKAYTPTTDMNLAMECFDKSEVQMDITNVGVYRVNYYINSGSYFVTASSVKELPLAICKAILKAKGIET